MKINPQKSRALSKRHSNQSSVISDQSERPRLLITDHCLLNTYSPKTLSAELKARGRLAIAECLRLGLSLCDALGHLHKNGLIHRDIKPSNIIFVNGVAKLADIGLVASMTEARTFVGTDGFIPPEGPGTAQADIYSLGKLLYEISTGRDRHEFPELPRDIDDLEDGGAAMLALNNVILRACEANLHRRYQTAEEFHNDLLRLRDGKPPVASGLQKLQRWTAAFRESIKRTPRTKAAVVATAVVAGLVLLILGTTSSRKAAKSSIPAKVLSLPSGDVLKIAYAGRPPLAAGPTAKPQLQFQMLAKREGDPQFTILKDGDTLRSQIDDYVIVARPLTAGYLYVFQIDSSGQKAWLFPKNETSPFSSGSNPVAPGTTLQLPHQQNDRAFYLDPVTGVEHVYAVFSATRWPELEAALAKPSRSSGPTDSALLARRVERPIGLQMRGVGGTRTNTVPTGAAQALERVHLGKTYPLTVGAEALEASGWFMAIERWFRHVQ